MDDEETSFCFTRFSHVAPILASNNTVKNRVMMSNFHQDCSVFPPNLHEGIYIDSNQDQIFTSQERCKEDEESNPTSKLVSFSFQRRIASCFEAIRSKFCGGREEAVGVFGVFSIAALVGFAGILIHIRRRHRREKEFLLFLVQDKNQAPSRQYNFQ